MLSAEEARDRDLGFWRGLIIILPLSLALWALVALIVIGVTK